MSAVYEEPVTIQTSFSERQLEMINHWARILWIGAGTKTGKSIALAAWLAEGILTGEPTAWCGPTTRRTLMGYELTKAVLEYPISIGEVSCNDSQMRLKSKAGGSFEPYTGENPKDIFGDGRTRFVIDEASRQSSMTLAAAATLCSATDGQIRLAFNLDYGSKNWAIENLLRVRAMSEAERKAAGEDYMLFPTLEGGFVRAEVMEQMKRTMPEAMFRALYYAEIPESDVSLFHNLEEMFSGPGSGGPIKGHSYIAGIDLARKSDYTVCSILDVHEPTQVKLVAAERFNTIDWTIQYAKLAEFTQRWGVSKSWFDATGLGDVVQPELEERGMQVEPYLFNEQSRKDLIEGLVVACDAKAIRASGEAQFERHKHELQMFGYEFKRTKDGKGKVRYAAPEHEYDDCVMSLALAWYGKQHGVFGRPRIDRVTAHGLRQQIGVW